MTAALALGCGLALGAGYLAASLAQYALHRGLGHERAGGWLRRRHVGQHHALYGPQRLTRARYDADEKSLSALYVLPAGALAAAAHAALPFAAFVAFAFGVALAYAANVWVHAQYHRERPILARAPGFARLRELHFVHHRAPHRNFAVVDLFWDRLFGTFASRGSSGAGGSPNPTA